MQHRQARNEQTAFRRSRSNGNGHLASMANDGKLVPANAPDHIRFAKRLLENFSYFGKKRRAGVVAEESLICFSWSRSMNRTESGRSERLAQEQRLL